MFSKNVHAAFYPDVTCHIDNYCTQAGTFFNQASVKMQAFIGVMKMNIVKVMVVLPVVPRNVLRPVSMENIN